MWKWVVGRADHQVVHIKMKHMKWLGHMNRRDQTMSGMKITDNTQNKPYYTDWNKIWTWNRYKFQEIWWRNKSNCDFLSSWFRASYSILIKIQPDATVRRYLFTAKSFYMFRVSHHPSPGVLKTVNAAFGTGHNTGTATSLQCGLMLHLVGFLLILNSNSEVQLTSTYSTLAVWEGAFLSTRHSNTSTLADVTVPLMILARNFLFSLPSTITGAASSLSKTADFRHHKVVIH